VLPRQVSGVFQKCPVVSYPSEKSKMTACEVTYRQHCCHTAATLHRLKKMSKKIKSSIELKQFTAGQVLRWCACAEEMKNYGLLYKLM
jgi:hypothetical protein